MTLCRTVHALGGAAQLDQLQRQPLGWLEGGIIQVYPGHEHYWNTCRHDRPDIHSPVGRAQYMLTDYVYIAHRCPDNWQLLCRYANTVQDRSQLLDLRHLAEYLKNRALGLNYGFDDVLIGIQAEQEIVLRSAPAYAVGRGHDIAPAARFLEKSELNGFHLSQGIRNLILSYAYFFGSSAAIERFADNAAANLFSDQNIAAACADIEDANLEWTGLERMEGIELYAEERPACQFDFKNSANPGKAYPRFVMYQDSMPEGAVMLQNGTVLFHCPDNWDRWQSALQKIDGTYTAPRYFDQADMDRFITAERVEMVRDLAVEDRTALARLHDAGPGKQSVREKLRDAVREVGQRSSQKGSARDGEAR